MEVGRSGESTKWRAELVGAAPPPAARAHLARSSLRGAASKREPRLLSPVSRSNVELIRPLGAFQCAEPRSFPFTRGDNEKGCRCGTLSRKIHQRK